MQKKPKTEQQLERHFKGVANHWRVCLLLLIAKTPGLSVEELAEQTHGNIKTVSEHTRRLVLSGLVDKKYSGRRVVHTLSPYGTLFAKFIQTFQHS